MSVACVGTTAPLAVTKKLEPEGRRRGNCSNYSHMCQQLLLGTKFAGLQPKLSYHQEHQIISRGLITCDIWSVGSYR